MRALAAAVAAVAALAGAAAEHAAAGRIGAPSRSAGSVVAKVVVRTVARSAPDGGRLVWRVPTATQWGKGPQWLLVLGSAADSGGREWLRVALPVRPNGAEGWIRADHALLDRSPWWVEVSTGRRTVSVYRDGRLVRRVEAVVGAPATPTPHGLFALHDPIRQVPGDGFLGPWALHLTAFSDVLENYGGGPGRVALHGRGGASLRDRLGTARSHGCVRLDNEVVSWLARVLPRGTPVRIAG